MEGRGGQPGGAPRVCCPRPVPRPWGTGLPRLPQSHQLPGSSASAVYLWGSLHNGVAVQGGGRGLSRGDQSRDTEGGNKTTEVPAPRHWTAVGVSQGSLTTSTCTGGPKLGPQLCVSGCVCVRVRVRPQPLSRCSKVNHTTIIIPGNIAPCPQH